MKMTTKGRTLIGGVLGMMTLYAAGCGGDEAPVEYQVLGPSAEAVRSTFNAGSGKIRALFLASPT